MEPLAELALIPAPWYQVPDADLVQLTAAARAAGHRWDAIAAACDNGPGMDIPAVIRQQYWINSAIGSGPLFSATQRAARNLTGRDVGYFPPLTWPCPGCGQQVTDLAPSGRDGIVSKLCELVTGVKGYSVTVQRLPSAFDLAGLFISRGGAGGVDWVHLRRGRLPARAWGAPALARTPGSAPAGSRVQDGGGVRRVW